MGVDAPSRDALRDVPVAVHLPLAALPLRPSLPQPSTEQVAVAVGAIAQSFVATQAPAKAAAQHTHTAMQLKKSQLRAQGEADETEGRPRVRAACRQALRTAPAA